MLTEQQIATLRAVVLAEPTLATARDTGDDMAIANWCNAPASPAFYLWRTSYTPDLISAAIDKGVTQLDGLTTNKRDSLLWWAERGHNAALAETQAAINDLCGSQNTLRAAVLDGGKRQASRAEKVLATGTGSLAVPATAAFEGSVTNAEAGLLR